MTPETESDHSPVRPITSQKRCRPVIATPDTDNRVVQGVAQRCTVTVCVMFAPMVCSSTRGMRHRSLASGSKLSAIVLPFFLRISHTADSKSRSARVHL